jgi:hypothetical protein
VTRAPCSLFGPLCAQIFSDIVFAEKNFLDGNFSREGFDYYLQLRSQMLAMLPTPHFVLYLDVTPAECHNRIHQLRKRVCVCMWVRACVWVRVCVSCVCVCRALESSSHRCSPVPTPHPRRRRLARRRCVDTTTVWLHAVQDCEDGIPLEYLAGLDTCYGHFLSSMRESGAMVVSMPWTHFGHASVVAEAIHAMPSMPPMEWLAEMKRVMHL